MFTHNHTYHTYIAYAYICRHIYKKEGRRWPCRGGTWNIVQKVAYILRRIINFFEQICKATGQKLYAQIGRICSDWRRIGLRWTTHGTAGGRCLREVFTQDDLTGTGQKAMDKYHKAWDQQQLAMSPWTRGWNYVYLCTYIIYKLVVGIFRVWAISLQTGLVRNRPTLDAATVDI